MFDARSPLHRARRLAALTALAAAAPAGAQTAPDLAARRELLERATAARAAGEHAQALDAAQRALDLQPSPSVRLFVAVEQSALGRHGEAFSNARLCRVEATRDEALRNRESILAECTRVEAEASARVGFVAVRPPASAGELTVRVNDASLPRVLWGAPFAVTAGRARVRLLAGARVVHAREVDVPARETVPVVITEEALRAPVAPDDAIVIVSGPSFVAPPRAAPPATRSAAPWVLFGAGAGGAVLGGALYGLSFALASGAAPCDEGNGDACARADAGPQALAVSGLVLAGVGGAAAVGGLLWAVLRPAPGGASARLEPGPQGLRVRF